MVESLLKPDQRPQLAWIYFFESALTLLRLYKSICCWQLGQVNSP